MRFFLRNPSRPSVGGHQPHSALKTLPKGKWEKIEATQLVPGDLVEIEAPLPGAEHGESPPLSCDIILLDGVVVMNESALTGEPMPVQKFSVSEYEEELVFALEKHAKKHLLHAGTEVLQSSRDPMMNSGGTRTYHSWELRIKPLGS